MTINLKGRVGDFVGKFVFKMQSILNLRVQIEQNLKNNLGRATQELGRQRGILEHIREEKEAHMENITHMYQRGIAVGKLQKYYGYVKHLGTKERTQQENIKKAQDHVEKCRRELVKAMKDKKILEKLKEKEFDDYVKQQNRREQRLNDEIISFNLTCSEI
ncbi:MAG: flagellar export protein FliJ [Clostridium sp.]|nr:flagellar export protein FliJ [Clostridium sp.]